jgi:hypothetical protein
MRTIAYFPNQCALNSRPVMSAVLDVLQCSGILTQENSMDSDAAVIWSVLWNGKMQANKAVYEHYRSQGKPVIIVEIGALYRGTTWKIAVNNITADGYYGQTEHLDWDRPRKLGISLAVTAFHRPEILIAAQHQHSLQVTNLPSIEAWIYKQILRLRQFTDRPIVVRPHPRSVLNTKLLPNNVVFEEPHPLKNTYDSFDMHFDCHAVVNYNSGPGIQAAISGTRPIVDMSSLAYPVSVSYAELEQPYLIDRDRWLVEICHTEYTLNEIQKGLWLQRISPALSTAPV